MGVEWAQRGDCLSHEGTWLFFRDYRICYAQGGKREESLHWLVTDAWLMTCSGAVQPPQKPAEVIINLKLRGSTLYLACREPPWHARLAKQLENNVAQTTLVTLRYKRGLSAVQSWYLSRAAALVVQSAQFFIRCISKLLFYLERK